MVYSFARINAVLKMKVRDYFVQSRRGWVRRHEKGGKEHEVPCHHNLEKDLDEYIAAAGIKTSIGNYTFRATGITAYLKNNGTLEAATDRQSREPAHDQALMIGGMRRFHWMSGEDLD
jgi:integrase